MKTTIYRTVEKVFQGAAVLGLSALFLFNEGAYAQHSGLFQPYMEITSIPGGLQANIFPSLDRLKLKVIFVNPAKESIKLIVRNNDQEIVYKKVIGKIERYNSTFDISGLPDGNYTLEMYGKSSNFSQNFKIRTQIAKLTHVQ